MNKKMNYFWLALVAVMLVVSLAPVLTAQVPAGAAPPPSCPSVPVVPYPANRQINIPSDQVLSWAASSNATGYNVYLDANPSPTTLVGSPTSNSFSPGALSCNTTYYWRVTAFNGSSCSVTGAIWMFETNASCSVLCPSTPANPAPANLEVNVSTSPTLN